MEGQGNRALLALCWIWIAIVIAYMVWGRSTKRACSAGSPIASFANGAAIGRS